MDADVAEEGAVRLAEAGERLLIVCATTCSALMANSGTAAARGKGRGRRVSYRSPETVPSDE